MTEEQDTLYSAMLDGRYRLNVTRTGPSFGQLTLADGDALLYSQPVVLAYGAVFGPDVDDVRQWQDIATRIVDGASK